MKTKTILILTIPFVLLGFYLVFNTSIKKTEKSWDFEKWQVDIEINKEGTFLVKEKQTFNFRGNFHWVTRDITKQKLRKISEVKVFDESGRELKGREIEISEDDNQVSIKLNFDLTDTQKTWIFQYRVHGGLGFFGEHDELYWNVISLEREVPIKKVDVFVYLPEEVSEDSIKQLIYLGPYGSKKTSSNYQVISGETLKYWGENIGPNSHFTIVAGWPKGIIQEPGLVRVDSIPIKTNLFINDKKTDFKTPVILEKGYEISEGRHEISVKAFGWEIEDGETKAVFVESGELEEIEFTLQKTVWLKVVSFSPFLIPLGSALIILKRRQKHSQIKKTIIAQYEPPDNLPPLELGALVDANIQNRDITAVIIDLAYRGYIKVIETVEKGLFGIKRKYTLVKTKKFSIEEKRMKEYEKSLCSSLFWLGKDRVQIEELKKKTYLAQDLERLKKRIFGKLVQDEYFKTTPSKEKFFYLAFFIVIPIIAIVSLVALKSIYRYVYLGESLVISGIIAFISLIFSPVPLTPKGAEAKWYALGFQEYLQVAERFRLGACDPKTFEKYLSYAIVFKVEEKWANRFAEIYKQLPSWFESSQSPSQFTVVAFTNSISSLSNSFSAAAVGSTSSSSGFGGGGFSGGGGGGGGSGAG